MQHISTTGKQSGPPLTNFIAHPNGSIITKRYNKALRKTTQTHMRTWVNSFIKTHKSNWIKTPISNSIATRNKTAHSRHLEIHYGDASGTLWQTHVRTTLSKYKR